MGDGLWPPGSAPGCGRLPMRMPKPMAPVLNRPVMEHVLRLLARHGFDDASPPALVPGDDRRPLRQRCGVRHRAHLLPRGAAAWHLRRRPQRGRLPRRLLPRHLRRRAHRHRPGGDARVPRIPRRVRHPGDQAGRRHDPVRRRYRRCRRPYPGLPGEARRGRGALDLANCGIYMFRARSSTTSRAGNEQGRRAAAIRLASPTGRWTSSRPCSRTTCPSTRTRSMPTERHRQPRRAAPGQPGRAARQGRGRSGRARGGRGNPRGELAGRGGGRGPGSGRLRCEIGDGVRIQGPAIVGDGCRIGAGAGCATRSSSPAPSCPPGRCVGAIAGRVAKS